MHLTEAVDAYLGEWVRGLPPKEADKAWYIGSLKSMVPLWFGHQDNEGKFWPHISQEGNNKLWAAARLLLKDEAEQRRITVGTARRCILQAHVNHLAKAQRTGVLSEHAVIAGAKKLLLEVERADGFYVIPVSFAPEAKHSIFQFGPAALYAKRLFEEKYQAAIDKFHTSDDRFDANAVPEWKLYSAPYDHFLVVDVKGHESEMAWKAAREVAEYVLNLLRLKFGFYHMDDVRLGNGFAWEYSQVSLYFDKNGAPNFTQSYGPAASHLDDRWSESFDQDFGPDAALFASLAFWIASGDDPLSPVLERLRYANALIAEAYSEPHDRIRLVRAVAALETLAALPKDEKSQTLAWRCAYVGGWADCGCAIEIVDDVLNAYSTRNAVVHGDAPDSEEAMSAFYRLERHLARIYIGFLHLYAKVERRYRPTHVRHIRRALDAHIEYFFWDQDTGW